MWTSYDFLLTYVAGCMWTRREGGREGGREEGREGGMLLVDFNNMFTIK
jgi:hypothetical protein